VSDSAPRNVVDGNGERSQLEEIAEEHSEAVDDLAAQGNPIGERLKEIRERER